MFTVKQWLNKVGSGTPLDAPSEVTQTVIDAAALRDLETRLAAYSETHPGPAGPAGAPGPGTVYVQAAAPVNPPVDSIWFESPDDGVTIVAMYVAVAT